MEPEQVPSKYGAIGKFAAVSAVVCLLSAGLCGLNWSLFSKYGAISGGTPEPPRSEDLSMLLMGTAFLELVGMGLGALGLVVSGVMALVVFVRERYAALGRDEDLE